MKYFTNCHNLDELKKEYRRLAVKHHPDHGGDTATMQAINAEYEAAFNRLKAQHNAAADERHQTTEAPEEFIRIIGLLLTIPGLVVELCGSWLWISGNTSRWGFCYDGQYKKTIQETRPMVIHRPGSLYF